MQNPEIIGDGVDLGFAEEYEPWLLTNRYFPSKIGGKPAWLELKNLPNSEEIQCPKCNKPRIFLCQIYAPIESREDCFHRIIYIFVCRNESCYEVNSANNIIVLRSQLSRFNDYYSSEPPNENEELPEVEGPLKLCQLCGCYGKFACSSCKSINYCGAVHQKLDWKYHKLSCKKDEKENSATVTDKSASSELLFPEYGVEMEPESENSNTRNSNENEEITESRRLKEYEEFIKSGKVDDLNDVPESELTKFVSENIEDKKFSKFKKRISSNPKQILRYHKGGQPLWITDKSGIIEEGQIPNCENCGSKRIFEFQIMPQLLNYLNDDQIDWGILAIYTCSQSCNTNSQYLKEFVVKQDVSCDTEPK